MTDILLVIMLDLHVSLTRKVNLPDMYIFQKKQDKRL
jgi:hypothetical protein